MQRVIQRTARAERNVARKLQKLKDHKERGESWQRGEQRKVQVADLGTRIKEARKNRQIDWATGPLAPRRDVGEQAATYGALSLFNLNPPERNPEKRPKWMHIAAGDRVVVVKGRERGKIGLIDNADQERGAVRVKGVNVMDVKIPDWMNREDKIPESQHIQAVPRLTPIEDVRLVYPLPDPDTGTPRDVIVERLISINRSYDKNKREWTDGDRVIPGTNTIIPWPEKADPTYEDHEDDTLRITVEERTFRPFLLHPPMPLSVIDELRNKHSKFRTRHDLEYLEKKELEDAKMENRKELIKGMRTPLQELAEMRAQQKKAAEKQLTEEQLARIGEVMAAEHAKATNGVRLMAQ